MSGRGGCMPLDALDQKTVTSLPRLSEVYDAYGVQVNALSVDEIFALYERTGFLYPDKAARLFPHLPQVRENWRRMLSAGESLLYVLTSGDKKRGRASLAVWRTTQNGWMSQHLVSENNPYASRAVMLAAAAASIRKGRDLSAQNWFRPENRFPARVFGSMVQTIGESLSSVQRHAYFSLPRRMSLPSAGGIRTVPYNSSRKGPLCGMNCTVRCESPLRMAKTSSLGGRNKHGAEQKKGIHQWSGPWNQILGREIDSLAETNSGRTHPPLSGCSQ